MSRRIWRFEVIANVAGCGRMIFGAVQYENDARPDRTAGIDPDITCGTAILFAKCLQQRGQRSFAERLVDHHAKRARLIVTHHQDNWTVEARIERRRCRDQKLARERAMPLPFGRTRSKGARSTAAERRAR
jgi:hypothetical protein